MEATRPHDRPSTYGPSPPKRVFYLMSVSSTTATLGVLQLAPFSGQLERFKFPARSH
jgi:hypothetical protein